MSDLERAQEWLGCERMTDDADVDHCGPHNDLAPDHEWPCPEATRLTALLAEVRADEATNISGDINTRLRSARSEELDDVAAEFERSADRVVKAKGETERTRYALEVVEVLRNRAREIRDGD